MDIDMDAIIAKAAADAVAAANKANKAKAAAEASSAAAKKAAHQERAKTILEASRAREMKAGLDLAEELLRDISPNVLRFLTREDKDRLIKSGVKLIINFNATDQSGSVPSFTIQRSAGDKNTRTIHRASIEQWAASEAMFLERFRREGGNPQVSSYHEVMLENIRLMKNNNRLRLLLERQGQKMLEEAESMPIPPMPADITLPSENAITPPVTGDVTSAPTA